jgi:hypothetical protein
VELFWRKLVFQFRASLGSIVSAKLWYCNVNTLTNSGNSPVPPIAFFCLFLPFFAVGIFLTQRPFTYRKNFGNNIRYIYACAKRNFVSFDPELIANFWELLKTTWTVVSNSVDSCVNLTICLNLPCKAV